VTVRERAVPSTDEGARRSRLRGISRDLPWQLPVLIVVGAVVIAIFTPHFLTGSNIRAILESAALTGIVAVTATPVTVSGNFFSLATQQSSILGAVLFAAMVGHGWTVGVAIVLTLLAVGATGLIQGLTVAAGLNAIIATLAAGSIILGAVAWRTHSQSVSLGEHEVAWLGIKQYLGLPMAVLVFIGVTIVLSVVSAKTTLGRQILLTGANRATARLSGIPTGRVTVWTFVISGFGSGIVGILTASAIGYADTQFFASLTFDVIAAILVGGTAIQGGFGSSLRSALGAVLIAMIGNAVLRHQFSSGVQQTIQGVLVLFVIVVLQSSLSLRRR
jgi:ribose/xylose/arabinose/galactoside ABC-type transport system permease subunit